MPDWQELVRRQLDGLALESDERADVIEELAAHLDELYEDLRNQGLTVEDAERQTLSEVRNWRAFRRRIQFARRKENRMTNRVTQLWLPCLLTFALTMAVLALIQVVGPAPRIFMVRGRPNMVPTGTIYIPWLLSLPLVGALGAFLSHRAGGTRLATFFSTVFPVVPYLIFFGVAGPLVLIFADHVGRNFVLALLAEGLIPWVVLPGSALLAGGLTVHFFLKGGRVIAAR
jgi:hypothetical protein